MWISPAICELPVSTRNRPSSVSSADTLANDGVNATPSATSARPPQVHMGWVSDVDISAVHRRSVMSSTSGRLATASPSRFGCNVAVEAGVGGIRGSAWFGWGPIGPGCGLTHQALGTADGSLHLSFGGGTVCGRRPGCRRCGCTCSPPRPPGGGADTLLGGKRDLPGGGGGIRPGRWGGGGRGTLHPGVDNRAGPSD